MSADGSVSVCAVCAGSLGVGQVADLTGSGGQLCGSGTGGSGGWALGNDIHALDTFNAP